MVRTTSTGGRPGAWPIAIGLCLTGLVACSMVEMAPPQPQPARAKPRLELDVPNIMRGTIASEAVMVGYQPVVVRGWGLVVGLDGTGSRDIPPSLRAHMLEEMARRGVGQETAGLGHIDPDQMLDSADTAVVVVEAVIPPGAVGRRTNHRATLAGTRFDIRVFADPRTGTTSLEGGRLYSAELRPTRRGELFPPTGSRQAAPLAEARGPVFVNPFAEPGALERDAVIRTVGRILNGGEAVRDIPIKLRLATPSHTRAEILENAINTRFPQERMQPDPTARGESDEAINITVPPSFRDTPSDFVELLRHTTIRQSGAEAVANSVKRALLTDPGAAYAAAWRWQALGPRALPMVRDLYDHPEELPRLAALRAGANLDDPLVIPPLLRMTAAATPETRRQAVGLMGGMRMDPRIDEGLRTRLNDDDLDVRLAAYESLIKRGYRFIDRFVVDGKFVLDIVESDHPMIYVTQVGQPRIAVFGEGLALKRPLYVDAWSGRFMINAGVDDERVEVYYRPPDNGDRTIEVASAKLAEFIPFLGHTTQVDAPAPGLGLSYGETVGALYEIFRQGYLDVEFKAEQDRVLAAIVRQQRSGQVADRPEFSEATGETQAESDLEQLIPPPALDLTGGSG